MNSSNSGSDSDEFFDAEDLFSHDLSARKSRKSRGSTSHTLVEEPDEAKFVNNSRREVQKSKKVFNELRQKLQIDDDDVHVATITPPNSQTSSIEGDYVTSNRTTHPFKVIEIDSVSLQSTTSIGRMCRLLTSQNDNDCVLEENLKAASTSALSSSSQESIGISKPVTSRYLSSVTLKSSEICGDSSDNSPSIRTREVSVTDFRSNKNSMIAPQIFQEPDVIASAKLSAYNNFSHEVPVAPPRRRRRQQETPNRQVEPVKSTKDMKFSLDSKPSRIEIQPRQSLVLIPNTCTTTPPPKPKPQATVKPTTVRRELTNKSLDIRQILERGSFVVRPQDVDRSKLFIPANASSTDRENVLGEDSNFLYTSKHETTVNSTSATSKLGRLSAAHYECQPRPSVGQYSLGSQRSSQRKGNTHSTERRKSAGDEKLLQIEMDIAESVQNKQRVNNNGKGFVKNNTSGLLSDYEILEKVTVLNLDTGERIPLSVAEDKLPQCINPLSLHIMRLTSEYISSTTIDKEKDSDEESVMTKHSDGVRCEHDLDEDDVDFEADEKKSRKKTAMIKKFLGSTVKKTMNKAKTIAHEVSHARHKEDLVDLVDDVNPGDNNIKLKTANSHKGPYDFEKVQHVQELKEHDGPIWCMKFSCCGRLLATAGQDRILRIWILKDAVKNFQDMRRKYNADKVSPTPSQESLSSHQSFNTDTTQVNELSPLTDQCSASDAYCDSKVIFMPFPFCVYSGHTSDIMDVSWSKNYFILSSSMDKTVRLWHISRKECLCCFQHIDFVTAIVFHPKDDRYFLSGSLDGKLRLWNIPDKKVAVWNEIEDGSSKLITAANFCQNGKFAVVGSYDGRCIFYHSDQLKYHTQINVRSTRGKNKTGRKISGIEPMPGEDKILVTSNDSRIRLYDLRDLNLSCKYRGYINVSSQIKGSFSHDGKYVICGSENRDIFIWKTNHDYSKFSSVRRDRNDFWEAIKAHNALVTCAIFAPNPDGIINAYDQCVQSDGEKTSSTTKPDDDPMVKQRMQGCGGYVIMSADFNGYIKIFINKTKPKHSSLPASALV